MKKILVVILSLGLCISLCQPVFAEQIETSGTCGEDMAWEYEDGTLYIEGTGLMDDFEEEAPWAAFKEEIKRLELKGEIEYIGARAFKDYDALQTVNFGSALYEIGMEAFMSCDGLTVIYLPTSFKVFGESSFNSCSNLTSIHCSGRFPSFRQNCLWNTFGKIYYPAERPWGVEYIEQLENAFKGRIEFLASDGTDHYKPEGEEVTEEPTEAPTAAPTEAPTETPTVAPTEAPTEAPTAAPTALPTEAPTAAPTEAPAPTLPVPEEKPESKSWIGLVIIGAAGGFLLMGAVATFAGSRRGRYSNKRKKR